MDIFLIFLGMSLFVFTVLIFIAPLMAENKLESIDTYHPNITFTIARKNLIFSNYIAEEVYNRNAKCWIRQSVIFCKPKWIKDFGRTYDVHYTSDKQRCFKEKDGVVQFDLKSCKMLIEVHYRENDILNMWIKNIFFVSIFLYFLPQQMHDSHFVYCVFLFTIYQMFGFGDNHSSEPRRVI